MFRTMIISLILLTASWPALAGEVNISGDWEFKSLLAKIYLHIEHQDDRIEGVAQIKDLFGDKNTYHFKGYFDQGKFVGYHHSGHVFRGEVASGDRIKGVLVTKEGRTYKFKAKKRRSDPDAL